jgi:bifunctional UDP-N-acetylglucosamine pyrophosphorylase/glucosamine-1-phosphate N-acetyltransferase
MQHELMEAVILAAGQGKRLLPLTQDIPKAMILINGKPMLQVILEQLKSVGITDIVIVVHYLKEKIMNYFGDGKKFGTTIRYVVQPAMKGSADAVVCAEPFITGKQFLCIACDSLFETALLGRILAHKSDGVFTCRKVPDARRYGVLVTEGNKVMRVIEKPEHPPTNFANHSVYLLPREIFAACKKVKPSVGAEYWLVDAIQILIDSGMTFEYEISENILDIGTQEQYQEAQELAKKLGLI